MKVLLVQPSFTILRTETKKCHPPLGLAYLAAMLKNDFEVKILDVLAEGYDKEEPVDNKSIRYGLPFEDIKKLIIKFSPNAVGVSCLFSAQSENVHKICRLVKEVDAKIITVIGGAHPSAVPEEVLSDKNVDFVVIGEGEVATERLLKCIETKGDVSNIEGVAFISKGRPHINCRKTYIEDLDALPFPYWDIFPLEKYFKINNPHGSPAKKIPFLPIITSRGCPFECIFCSVHNIWGRNYRKRSADNVLKELGQLVNKFGVKEILFEDDNFTLDKGRAEKILQGMIDKKLDIIWSTPNGIAAQTLDDKLLTLMRRSGCYRISIGVESGDEYVLENIIKKPIVLSNIKPVIRKAKKLGLETGAFFVVGLPGENRVHLKNTFRFAENLGTDNINFFFATPLPGTRLLELCKEKKLINEGLDYSNLKSDYPNFSTESFSATHLRNMVFYETVKLHLIYLLRNPGKFLYKLWNKFLNEPVYFSKLMLKYTLLERSAKNVTK